jgi:putative tryptophan/tyrosine transport system substrate-binding protein
MLNKSALSFALIPVVISALPLCTPRAVAQDKVWRIGFLDPSMPPTAAVPSANLEAFRQGLDGLGYLEGQNNIIEARFADTDRSRLPTLAKELVDQGVDVIVTVGTPTVFAAKKATATIPIIMAGSYDPVGNGLVASLAHPGGNVTGFAHLPGPEFAGKALQLLKDAAPNISRIAILADSEGIPWEQNPRARALSSAAKDLELTLLPHDVIGVKSETEFDSILSKIVEERADALFVFPDFVNNKYEKAILDFASANRLPSMGQHTSFVERGGLMYYYTDWSELRRRAAAYVDKIFKGAMPADLPVQQPSRFELIVNVKTAEALGLTIPRSVLALADKVIE